MNKVAAGALSAGIDGQADERRWRCSQAGRRARRPRSTARGAMRVGNGVFHCHKRGGHGPLDMQERDHAELRHLFLRDGPPARLRPRSRRSRATLGLGQKFDLPFATQRYGTVPDSAWKLKKYKARLDRRRLAQRVDRPGLCAGQPAAAGGDGGAASPRAARCSRSMLADARPPRRRPPLPRRPRASRDRPRRDVRRGQRRRHRRRGAAADPRRRDRRQDRHRAGPPHHHGRARAAACSRTRRCRSSCATTRCSSASRRPTTRATPLAVVLEHNGHTVAQPRHAADRPRHHDLSVRPRPRADSRSPRSSRPGAATSRTRMAAEAAAYNAAQIAAARGGRRPRPTRPSPTDAAAVEAATDAANATQAARSRNAARRPATASPRTAATERSR